MAFLLHLLHLLFNLAHMAKNNKKKFNDDTPFDESLLIGSLSGFNSNFTSNKNNSPDTARGGEGQAETAAAEPKSGPEDLELLDSAAGKEKESKGENKEQVPVPDLDTAISPGAVTPEIKPNLKPGSKPKSGKGWEHSRFLTPTSGRKEETVYISADLKKRIRAVLLYSGLNSIAMADYLENILVEHFERYGTDIEELRRKFME